MCGCHSRYQEAKERYNYLLNEKTRLEENLSFIRKTDPKSSSLKKDEETLDNIKEEINNLKKTWHFY
jgi:RNA:NAD 2'-phosphotransferase (TPT1/KptA family)